jgi:hypothetical protein
MMQVHAIFQLEMNGRQRYNIKCYIKDSIMQYVEFGKIGLEISGLGALSYTKESRYENYRNKRQSAAAKQPHRTIGE